MKRAVMIVAAGSGSRMGGDLPKQYLPIHGKPILIHTLERFRQFDAHMNIVVVVAKAHKDLWEQLQASHAIARDLSLAWGGATRFETVKNGLDHVYEEALIGIHDAVRPLVGLDTLSRCYDAAERTGSGIPALDLEDSVRMLDDQGSSLPMDRSRLKRVQTPQVFRSEEIKEAYRQEYRADFTDDASVYETSYGSLTLVEGNRENIKITTPMDLKLAELLMGLPH
jgi:2-C-methyl-D-erythritol 4-phosphate cytidylyltransferase